ncbi:MAG: sensor domain-containing diguanylate cyclase [Mobilitalea sp.]
MKQKGIKKQKKIKPQRMEKLFSFRIMIAFIFALLIGLSCFYITMKNTIVKDSQEQTINTIQSLTKYKNMMLTNKINDWYLYAETLAALCMDEEEEALNIEKFNAIETPYVMMFDETGTVISGKKINDSIKEYAYYEKVMAGERTIISMVEEKLENSKETFAIVAVPIINEEDTVIGGILCAYKMSEISETLKNSDMEAFGDSIIIDQNGQIITGTRTKDRVSYFYDLPKDDNFFLDEDKKNEIRTEIEKGKSDFVQLGAGDNNRLIVYEHNISSEWTVVTMVDRVALESFSYDIPKNLLSVLRGGIIFIGIMYVVVVFMYLTIIRISQERSEILKAEKNELADIVMRDSMTGLYNKKTAMDMIKASLRTMNKEKKHALLFVDIDNFKTINDDYGHEKGDQLIILFAEIMKKHFRRDDIIARFGGDEFIILVKDYGNETVLRQRAESLCGIIIEESKTKMDFLISISIGIAVYPDHGKTYEELIQNADKALYWSKKEGKSQYHIYDNDSKFLGQ